MSVNRELLGRWVRQVWVQWASEQDDPKPSWLAPWEEIDDGQREVDMRIGEVLYEMGRCAENPIRLVGESDPCGGVHVGTKESYPACVVCGDTGESDPGEVPPRPAEEDFGSLAVLDLGEFDEQKRARQRAAFEELRALTGYEEPTEICEATVRSTFGFHIHRCTRDEGHPGRHLCSDSVAWDDQ